MAITALSRDPQRHHEQLSSVISYYDGTWFDYRWVWLNSENNAIHFGFHDERRRSHADSLLNTNRVLADIADIGPTDRVLDAGCGIAGSTTWLAEQRGATVVGITLVPTQVERARRLVAARRLEHVVTIEQVDYTRTPFPDATFDVVWALESVCHSAEKAAFYRESARLLRPGGRLIVAEYVRAARPLPDAEEALLAHWLRSWMIPDLDTAQQHAQHARAAGLSEIAVRDVTANVRRSLRRLYALSLAGVPISRVLHKFGLRGAIPHGNALGSMYQYRALRRGCWAYSILCARKSPAESSVTSSQRGPSMRGAAA